MLETNTHHQAASPLAFIPTLPPSAGVKTEYATILTPGGPVVRHRIWFTRSQVQQFRKSELKPNHSQQFFSYLLVHPSQLHMVALPCSIIQKAQTLPNRFVAATAAQQSLSHSSSYTDLSSMTLLCASNDARLHHWHVTDTCASCRQILI